MNTHETLLGRSLRRLRRAWSELGSTLRGERQEIDAALGAEAVQALTGRADLEIRLAIDHADASIHSAYSPAADITVSGS